MESEGRPHCALCGVDMWLTRIVDAGSSKSYVFECQVCGAQATLSSAQVGNIELGGQS